jgi:hypothetical protein
MCFTGKTWFYKESDVLYREDLVGVWSDQKNGKWQILPFEKKNAYAITLTSDEGVAATFIAHLFSLGNTIYLDFVPEEQEGKQVDLFALRGKTGRSVCTPSDTFALAGAGTDYK